MQGRRKSQRKIRNYFELKDNENATYQIYGIKLKAMLKAIFIVIY